ncbi:MAG: DUF4339 domain-containing protein, partial [Verrucomicrobiota bacterium]|nr:DUF4339 domain-containing protein [Verrucomicrobiota bacterium]
MFYILGAKNSTHGPYDLGQIIDFARNGLLMATTLVWSDLINSWVEARTLNELKFLATPTAPNKKA